MSSAYNRDSTHDQNPNCTIPPQNQEEDDPPFSLHLLPSPFLDDNQLFLNHMMFPYHQNHQQHLMIVDDQINYQTDSRYTVINKHDINTIKTTEEISTLTTRTTTATQNGPTSSSSEVAQMGKASTDNDTNNKKKAPSTTQRKRGKKDRHSKICTAQGVRDRRMRLSLQIARKFFDLQDMLGFDKASKTIDWLFSKSKKAIKKLSCNADNLAQMNNNIVPNNLVYYQVETDEMIRKALTTTSDSVSGERKTRKTGGKYNHNNAKEMREKARARARERTREKMMMRCLENAKQNYLLNHHQTSTGDCYNLSGSPQLGYAGGNPNSVVFEAGEEEEEELMSMSSCPLMCHYKDLNSHSSSLHHQLANVGILDNFVSTSTATSSAASCSIFDYPRNDNAFLFSGKNPKPIFMGNSCYHHFQTETHDD